MITSACNFAFSLWGKKYLQLRLSLWVWFTSAGNPWTLHTRKDAQSVVVFWLSCPPSVILLMPSECYISFLCFVFLSLFLFGPSKVEEGITGRPPGCSGCCSGRGGPSSSGCRPLHTWRCGCRAASPPASRRRRCCGRWTAWRARCWTSAWARGRLLSTPGGRKHRQNRCLKMFLLIFFVEPHYSCQVPNSFWMLWCNNHFFSQSYTHKIIICKVKT